MILNSKLSIHLFDSNREHMDEVAVTIPGDTAGTWVMSGNAAGVCIISTLEQERPIAAANAWASTNYWGYWLSQYLGH